MRTRLGTVVLALVAGVTALLWSGALWPERPGDLLTQAQAIRGRPLTPLSYAGVALAHDATGRCRGCGGRGRLRDHIAQEVAQRAGAAIDVTNASPPPTGA